MLPIKKPMMFSILEIECGLFGKNKKDGNAPFAEQ